jgi:hypothetical protein
MTDHDQAVAAVKKWITMDWRGATTGRHYERVTRSLKRDDAYARGRRACVDAALAIEKLPNHLVVIDGVLYRAETTPAGFNGPVWIEITPETVETVDVAAAIGRKTKGGES